MHAIRNLFGFKDGTANLKSEHPAAVDEHVWVGHGDDPNASWLVDGSFLVGRDRSEGAPLSGGTELTAPDFKIRGRDDGPLIPLDAHVRLAHPEQNNGVQMLRRGYNFTDGNDALGRLEAGLFFISYVRDPDAQFIPMQNRLAQQDGLMEYLKHTGSGLFAVPPGIRKGGYVGDGLFA